MKIHSSSVDRLTTSDEKVRRKIEVRRMKKMKNKLSAIGVFLIVKSVTTIMLCILYIYLLNQYPTANFKLADEAITVELWDKASTFLIKGFGQLFCLTIAFYGFINNFSSPKSNENKTGL